MPLLDHFRPPTSRMTEWSSLHSVWIVALVRWLNRTLPRDDFRAYANARTGTAIESDVIEYESRTLNGGAKNGSHDGGVATLMCPPMLGSASAVFPDDMEVMIGEGRHQMQLSAVIELVSPGNKKETSEREAFLAKCVSYLRRGIGVVVVDIITNRRVNLHNDLVAAIGGSSQLLLADDPPAYVAAYKPVNRRGLNLVDVWAVPAEIGQPVPCVPLALRRGPLIPLDLERTYTESLEDSNLL